MQITVVLEGQLQFHGHQQRVESHWWEIPKFSRKGAPVSDSPIWSHRLPSSVMKMSRNVLHCSCVLIVSGEGERGLLPVGDGPERVAPTPARGRRRPGGGARAGHLLLRHVLIPLTGGATFSTTNPLNGQPKLGAAYFVHPSSENGNRRKKSDLFGAWA